MGYVSLGRGLNLSLGDETMWVDEILQQAWETEVKEEMNKKTKKQQLER